MIVKSGASQGVNGLDEHSEMQGRGSTAHKCQGYTRRLAMVDVCRGTQNVLFIESQYVIFIFISVSFKHSYFKSIGRSSSDSFVSDYQVCSFTMYYAATIT